MRGRCGTFALCIFCGDQVQKSFSVPYKNKHSVHLVHPGCLPRCSESVQGLQCTGRLESSDQEMCRYHSWEKSGKESST